MCHISEECQSLKEKLLDLVDDDTDAFQHVLYAYRLPNSTKEQELVRNEKIDIAMKKAVIIPFKILQCCHKVMKYTKKAVNCGNQNSITDAGVGAEMANAGALGAALNIKINLNEVDDIQYCKKMQKETDRLIKETGDELLVIRKIVFNKLRLE